jgi:hypothetical protein
MASRTTVRHRRLDRTVARRTTRRNYSRWSLAAEERRRGLAAKIAWVKNHETPNQQAADRFVRSNPYSKLIFADGTVESCLVIDYSVTGAAVSADTVSDFKAVLAVGSVVDAFSGTSPYNSLNTRAVISSRPGYGRVIGRRPDDIIRGVALGCHNPHVAPDVAPKSTSGAIY